MMKINEKYAAFCQQRLLDAPDAHPAWGWLRDLGLKRPDGSDDLSAVWRFGLGLALPTAEDIRNWALAEVTAADDRELVVSELSRLANRILMPVRELTGDVVGFCARVMPGSTSPGKYVNSRETPTFQKRQIVYGLDVLAAEGSGKRTLQIYEGQVDVWRAYEAGSRSAVCAPLSPEGAAKLVPYAEKAVLRFEDSRFSQRMCAQTRQWLESAGVPCELGDPLADVRM